MSSAPIDNYSYVVIYKGLYFVWYKLNRHGMCQLITTSGKKYSGTPSPEKLEVIKPLEHKEFNNSQYFNTKIGVFSAATGNKITHPKILTMFKE